MDILIDRFKNAHHVAVVGATDNPNKFGYKVFKKLQHEGKIVYAVNPTKETIDGEKVYSKLSDITGPIDAISLIVNPLTGLQVLADAYTKGIRLVWCQPGAESPELIAWCAMNDMACIVDRCVLVDI